MIPVKAGIDRLPTWLRDFLVAFVATSLGLVLQAVVSAGGVTGVDWPDAALAALNAGAVAAAAVGLLAVTRLTRAYGRGSDAGHADVRVPIIVALIMALAAIVVSAALLSHPAPDRASGPDNKSWAVILS